MNQFVIVCVSKPFITTSSIRRIWWPEAVHDKDDAAIAQYRIDGIIFSSCDGGGGVFNSLLVDLNVVDLVLLLAPLAIVPIEMNTMK